MGRRAVAAGAADLRRAMTEQPPRPCPAAPPGQRTTGAAPCCVHARARMRVSITASRRSCSSPKARISAPSMVRLRSPALLIRESAHPPECLLAARSAATCKHTSCRSLGGAATSVGALVAAGEDEEHERWLDRRHGRVE